MAARRRSTYLIQDPYDTDAIEFIRTIELHYGMRPVVLCTDPKTRFYGERDYPQLGPDMIEETYDIDVDDLGPVVAEIRHRFDVHGVVPFREDTVELAAELCELFELDWNDASTLRRFRDKVSMLSHVSQVAPHVRVPDFRLVSSAAQLTERPLPSRFVVKPNEGFGNVAIGIFGRDEIDLAREHITMRPGVDWVVQEFVGGTEYHVDGQVRPNGDVEVLAVYEYVRGVLNGYPTVYLAEIQIQTTEPQFAPIASYAVELLAALGLRGCPFHLEVKVDDDGPCVVDLGARLASEGTGRSMTRMHPERPGVFLVAAHDYLGRNELVKIPLGWDRYDACRAMFVYGISEEATRITTLEGVADVEAMPEFVRWPAKPTVGMTIDPTEDLLSAPWVVEVEADMTRAEGLVLAETIRPMIGWNRHGGRSAGTTAAARDAAPRALRKASWLLRRATSHLRTHRFRSRTLSRQ